MLITKQKNIRWYPTLIWTHMKQGIIKKVSKEEMT